MSTSIQYPGHHSGVNIRDKAIQYPGTIHHGYTCYTRVILNGNCLVLQFTAWCSFDVAAPVPDNNTVKIKVNLTGTLQGKSGFSTDLYLFLN